MKLTKSQLKRIIKEELLAVMKEHILDDTMPRLDRYLKTIADWMTDPDNAHYDIRYPEAAIAAFIDLAVAGGDPYLDPEDERYDEALRANLEGSAEQLRAMASGDEPEEEEGTVRTKRVTPQSIERVKRSIGRRRGVGMGSPRGAASRHKTSQFDR